MFLSIYLSIYPSIPDLSTYLSLPWHQNTAAPLGGAPRLEDRSGLRLRGYGLGGGDDFGHEVQGLRLLCFRFRVYGLGDWVWNQGLRAQGLGFRVWGLGFGIDVLD